MASGHVLVSGLTDTLAFVTGKGGGERKHSNCSDSNNLNHGGSLRVGGGRSNWPRWRPGVMECWNQSNSQRPTSNAQRPTPNVQRPTSNAQRATAEEA